MMSFSQSYNSKRKLFSGGAAIVACASLFFSSCQKERVQPLPKVTLPAGAPFVLVQPQLSVQPADSKTSPYIGVLTGVVSLPSHLVVSGYQGTILRYSRSSKKWTRVSSSVHGDFYGMTVTGSGTLWISGDRGLLMKSPDAGLHWSAVTSGVAPLFLNAISFPTPKVGYIVGEKGTILKTVDGGDHWSRLSSPVQKNLYGVAFSDELHGVLGGWHKTLLTTSDGGDHFNTVDLPIQKITRQKPSLNSIWSQGKIVLVAGDHGLLFQSTDGGRSFTQIQTGGIKDLYGVCRMGNGDIIAVGERGELIVLSSGSQAGWKVSRPLGSFHGTDWLSVSCGNARMRVVGSNGSILLQETNAPSLAK